MNRVSAVVLVVVLGSGAGLLALGLVSLARAAHAAEVRARAEAGAAAETTARVLRAALAQPAWVEAVPAERRFALEGGELVVPEAVGWLDPPVEGAPPWPVDDLLREAQRQEFDGDAASACATLGRAEEAAPDDATRRVVEARHGWLALRCGEVEHRDRALQSLEAHVEALPPRVLAATLLLQARVDGVVPEWGVSRFGLVPADVAGGVLASLAADGVDGAALRNVRDAVAARRALLRRVRDHAPLLRDSDRADVLLDAGALIVFVPQRQGEGQGAVVDVETALRAARATPAGAGLEGVTRGQLVVGAQPDDARVVVPGVLGVRPAPVPAGPGAFDPTGLGGLLVVLALCFSVGLLLAFRALRRESRALAVRGEFLTMVTHELKTPVASIRLLAELLAERRVEAPDKRDEHLRLLSGEAVRLAVLVENVLDLGRTERGERSYDRRPHDVVELVREAQDVFAPIARDAGMVVTVELAPAAGSVRVDRHALMQVLLNVLDNARRYAAEGCGIEVTGGMQGDDRYRVAVRDRGAGVPADERERIFARFRRGRREASGHVPGVGIGLYLAREIAHAHGGELVCVAPDNGGPGACFVLTLPVEASS